MKLKLDIYKNFPQGKPNPYTTRGQFKAYVA